MAGNRHQFVLGLVIKMMREEGAAVYGVDGNYPGLFGEKISLPPQIMRHRPDAIGMKADGQICIGEAKTEGDISKLSLSLVEVRSKPCFFKIGFTISPRIDCLRQGHI